MWEFIHSNDPRYLLCSRVRIHMVSSISLYDISEIPCTWFAAIPLTFLINMICSFEWWFQIGASYFRFGLTIAATSCLNISLAKPVNDLRNVCFPHFTIYLLLTPELVIKDQRSFSDLTIWSSFSLRRTFQGGTSTESIAWRHNLSSVFCNESFISF